MKIVQTERQPFVSVIMNCYNSSKFLGYALESVICQTFSDWELIFWDNQSTDESASVFKSFSDDRLHYFLAQEHTILAKAKVFAVEKARGKWLAFLDCDDLWLPEKLEKQVKIILDSSPTVGLVYGRVDLLVENQAKQTALGKRALVNRERLIQARCPEGEIFEEVLKENFIPQPSVMVSFKAYLSVGGINPNFKHAWDFDLWTKILSRFEARAVQSVCCIYRIHAGNLSHVQLNESFQEVLQIVNGFLPSSVAARAIQNYQTEWAIQFLRAGYFGMFFQKLISEGSFECFFEKLFKYIRMRAKTILKQV